MPERRKGRQPTKPYRSNRLLAQPQQDSVCEDRPRKKGLTDRWIGQAFVNP
jgi:hypothetical protein